MINILIVDDHEVVRQGLNLLLASDCDMAVVGQAADGLEALDLSERLQPDVVLMDISMPRMDGMTATRILRERHCSTKIIIFSGLDDRVVSQMVMNAGANRILHKSASSREILQAVRAVYEAR